MFAEFSFVLGLGVVVNNCEFAVIFTVHIFDLLFHSLDLIFNSVLNIKYMYSTTI